MSSDPLCRLRVFGHCLDDIRTEEDWATKMPTSCEKACFILADGPTNCRLKLGAAPFNDCVSFGKIMREHNFEIFYLRSPTSSLFRSFFGHLLEVTQQHLCLFYAGHGHLQRAISGTAGGVPTFPFGDDPVTDTEFLDLLDSRRRQGCRLTLVTDSCEPESVFDIRKGDIKGRRLEGEVVSISALADPEMIREIKLEPSDHGAFVTDFVKWFKKDPTLTPFGLRSAMRKVVKQRGEEIVIGVTDDALLRRPLFE